MDIKILMNNQSCLSNNLNIQSLAKTQATLFSSPQVTETSKLLPNISQPEDNQEDLELRKIYTEIHNLIGLTQVKNLIYEIQAYIQIQNLRKQQQLKSEPIVLHAIFSGNPGSGKTTMARLLGKLYFQLGFLSKGHLLEVERADLVGEYIGHTAKKTKELIGKAKGGVLFIDEAYSLARGGSKDFGREAIDALVKGMEDFREDFVLILAGYKEEMAYFLSTNPGLNSRFPLHIDFPNYSLKELLAIADLMYKNREYSLSPASHLKFGNLIETALQNYPLNHGNGRLVRNLVEASLRKQAVRLTTTAKIFNPNLSYNDYKNGYNQNEYYESKTLVKQDSGILEINNDSVLTRGLTKRELMEILPCDLQINLEQLLAKTQNSKAKKATELQGILKMLENIQPYCQN